MKNKILIYSCIIIFLALIIPNIIANELEIQLLPRYFSQGYEVTYTPDIEVSGIKFEIIGKNNNLTSRILDIMVLDSNIDFPNETKGLRINQKKSLWMSDLLDINQSNLTYFAKVFGINEKSDEIVYANDSVNIIIENKESSNLLKEVGGNIAGNPEDYKVGLYVGGGIILCIGVVLWKYQIKDYLNKKSYEWKVREAQKRKENYEGEEGF